MENPVAAAQPIGSAPGNTRVLVVSSLAFTLGFAVWGMFSALGPFLIKWYDLSATQVLVLAAMEPFFAAAVSIPLGIFTDKFGGRLVFTLLLFTLTVPLILGPFARGYYSLMLLGAFLGLGGASFVVGNAHVASWYPKTKQGMALGIFALGNIGITVGMMTVTVLVTRVLTGPDGWRLVFPCFAVATFVMAQIYWFFTSDSPYAESHGTVREILAVYRSGVVVWLVPYLYWVSFGTLTFFASAMPTYLLDRWHMDPIQASMVYTPLLVVCVAVTRPLGGWLADRFDVLRILSLMFGAMVALTVLLTLQISVQFELFAIYGLALLSGTSAAAVVKLIPLYFREVGAVSGLAKAAGAACGFTMTMTLAASKNLLGGYTVGFAIWAVMNAAAWYIALSRVGFRNVKPVEAVHSNVDSTIDVRVRVHGQA